MQRILTTLTVLLLTPLRTSPVAGHKSRHGTEVCLVCIFGYSTCTHSAKSSGTGNTVATIAGAIGGALVGNEVQKQQQVAGDRYRVTVQLDSGGLATFEQRQSMVLRLGDRVRVENNRVYLI